MDKVLDQLAAVIITFVDASIHPLVTQSDVSLAALMKSALSQYFSAMQVSVDDKIEDLTLKHRMRLDLEPMLNQYYLSTTQISTKGSSEEIDHAYFACAKCYGSAKALLDQYHAIALRSQGHQI